MSPQQVRDELLDIEHAGWDALCTPGGGAEFYADLMIDEAVMIIVTGDVLDRDATIASLRDAPPWLTYRIEDARVIMADDRNAVLVYTARAQRGEEVPFVARMASTYTRRGDRWRLVTYQQTPLVS